MRYAVLIEPVNEVLKCISAFPRPHASGSLLPQCGKADLVGMPLGRDRVHGRPHLLGLNQESRRGEAFESVAMSQPRIGTRIFSPAWRMYVKTDFSKTGNSPKQRGRIVHWPAIGARSFTSIYNEIHS